MQINIVQSFRVKHSGIIWSLFIDSSTYRFRKNNMSSGSSSSSSSSIVLVE